MVGTLARKKLFNGVSILSLIVLLGGCFVQHSEDRLTSMPITLKTQGSFAIGGTTLKHPGTFTEKNFLSPEGQTAYGDHAYAFYQIPSHARQYPLVFQHGGAQTKRTWESTPDGRDGFQNIFLKKNYSVYLVDQPRMGEAGLATKADDGNNPWAGKSLIRR